MKVLNNQDVTNTDKRPYQPAELRVWGEVSSMTRAGGSGGSGDLAYNPAGNSVGREDGSATLGFDKPGRRDR